MDEFLVKKVSELRDAKDSANIAKIKDLGSDFAEEAFMRQDPLFVDFSIIAYSLAKFLEKPYIVGTPKWIDFREDLGDELDEAVAALKKGDRQECAAAVARIHHRILDLSATMGRFVSSVIDKARIKAATQMYAHGASLGAAAKLSGANKKELSKYIGMTRIPEKYATIPVKNRLAEIEKLFK
ncbi:MAG: hypothetical protein NTY90_03200 [Candidatus Micrarchaeota archaeon]|nr:hypothetical protein [Candidatus Micrarchaeota archaeon]